MSFTRKLSKLSRAISLLIQKPTLLNVLLDQEEIHQEHVIKQFNLPDGLPEIPFEVLCENADLKVSPFAFLDGGSLPTDLSLLRQLALRIHASSYFEIGTWRGESVANVAEVVQECHTLNLSAEEMRSRGWDEKYIQLHGFFSKNNDRVKHLEGDSRTFDFKPYEQKQNLVFVDGDHHFDSVVKDTQTAFRLINGRSGAIVWHDYGHSPETVRWNVLHGILKGTPPEERGNLYAVSNTLCAVWLPEKIASRKRVNPQVPEIWFSLQLNQHKR